MLLVAVCSFCVAFVFVSLFMTTGHGCIRKDNHDSHAQTRDIFVHSIGAYSGSVIQGADQNDEVFVGNTRFFDLTISLWSNPLGDSQDKYEKIIQFMADAIYEATEGAHKLRKIRIFRNSERFAVADIQWTLSGRPVSALSGIGDLGFHIRMYDVFKNGNWVISKNVYEDLNFLVTDKDIIWGGYTLAHEFVHYAHGCSDEYPYENKNPPDVGVMPSIMNSQFNAYKVGIFDTIDHDWLQLSIKNQNPTSPGKFQDTLKTEQHRTWEESCWETLTRPNVLTETFYKDGRKFKLTPTRAFYPELAVVAPTGTNSPRIDCTEFIFKACSKARTALEIIWATDTIVYEIVLDSSGSMEGAKIDNAKTAAKLLVDLVEFGSEIGVIAFTDSPDTILPIMKVEDSADKAKIKDVIDLIVADGGTAIGAAAQAALDELLKPTVSQGTKVVFLLSDGESTRSDPCICGGPDSDICIQLRGWCGHRNARRHGCKDEGQTIYYRS